MSTIQKAVTFWGVVALEIIFLAVANAGLSSMSVGFNAAGYVAIACMLLAPFLATHKPSLNKR